MSSVTSTRSVPPPSLQEVTRKLSVHSAAKHIKKPTLSTAPISGTESDSDSVISPEAQPASPLNTPLGISHGVGSLTQPPLQSIAERRSGSGEESEEDEEDEEGGWRVEAAGQARGSHDETVLKTGYLWKKGERRKTWKKRWFVLRPAHLAFYKTAAEYKLLRLVDLAEIHSCSPVQLKKHANTFVMVSPTRTFYLQADSPQDVSEWVKAITEARTSLLATSTQNSATAPIPIPTSASQGRHSYQQHSAPPASPSLSHSPYNHHLTSSDSEDALPSTSGPSRNANTTSPSDTASPSKQPGSIDTYKVIISGYLMKCGARRHIWHNRWFVLTGDKLVYSRSHMDAKPHRSIPLAQILDALEYDLPPPRPAQQALQALSPPHHSTITTEELDGGAGKHTFKIVTTKRTLLLCAPREEEEIKWLSAVRALIARRSVVPGDSAAAQQSHSHSHSLPVPLPLQGQASNAHSPSVASNVRATVSASVPASSGEHGPSSSSGGNTPPGSSILAGGSATVPHRRRDSIAKRLSLGGSGSFMPQPTSNNSQNGGGGGGGSTGVSQEA